MAAKSARGKQNGRRCEQTDDKQVSKSNEGDDGDDGDGGGGGVDRLHARARVCMRGNQMLRRRSKVARNRTASRSLERLIFFCSSLLCFRSKLLVCFFESTRTPEFKRRDQAILI